MTARWWPFGAPPRPFADADAEALKGELEAMTAALLAAPGPDPRETWLAEAASAVHGALRDGEVPASLAVLAWTAGGGPVTVTVGVDGSVRREAGREAAT